MVRNLTLGRYIPGDSLIHRLDPRTKLVFSVFMMVITLLAAQGWQLLTILAMTLVFVTLSGLSWKRVLAGLRPIRLLLVFAFVVNLLSGQGTPFLVLLGRGLTLDGLLAGIKSLVRLSLLVINTTLFMTLTTTPILIADAIERLLSPLARFRFPVHEIAMMMSIALRFVPTLLEEADKIMKAQSARGADYDTGNPLQKARGFISILIPLFVSAFRRADDLATAMEARCYQGGVGRTRFRVMHFTRSDLLFAIIVTAVGLLTQLLAGTIHLSW